MRTMTVVQMLRACGCLSLAALVGACAASEGDENDVAADALNVIVAPAKATTGLRMVG